MTTQPREGFMRTGGSKSETQTPRPATAPGRAEPIAVRELRRENARLWDAIDNLLTAYYLPGEHCELSDAMEAAHELIQDMGPEKPAWVREGARHE